MIGHKLSKQLRLRAGRHVKTLARDIDARVSFTKRMAEDEDGDPGGKSWHTDRRTIGPPIRTALDYFVHLHELGHLAARGGADRGLRGEAAAWEWARTKADPEIMATMTETAWISVGRMLTSYVRKR